MDTQTPAAVLIAVVDDDPMVTLMVSRVLAKDGYGVKVYGSGEAAVDGVVADGVRAVCLDMSLPGIDGLETLARLKALQPALPVVLFTAAADEVATQAREAGAFACVAKTGAWAELRTVVASALATVGG